MAETWIEEEFAGLSLGDSRLDQRVKMCVADAESIGESNPDRARSKAALKGLYRLVDNPNADADTILGEHNRSSQERCAGQSTVYLVQDTTEIDLTKPKCRVAGAGPLAADSRQGFFFHPLYAVDQDGVALGVVDQVIWTRDPQSLELPRKERDAARKRAYFEEKESCRWMEMLQSGEQLARSLPEVNFIAVSDSESDITELLCEAGDLPPNFHFIIRQCREHLIVSAIDSATNTPIAAKSVDEALSKATARTVRTVAAGGREAPITPDDKKRSRKQARTSREATLNIRAIQATIAGPRRSGGGCLPEVTINIVEAIEANPPEGEEPIRWVLFTTLPIQSLDDLDAILTGYCRRWQIELYFKTLKSGLKIEDMRYETLSRYLVAFSMLLPVAWRVEHLKGAARHCPEAPCDKYYTTDEWNAVMIFLERGPVQPGQPPTMREFVTLIAELGGYIRKKQQGPPGSQTIWRGMSRFHIIAQAYRIFVKQTCGV
ncbi:MAG: IS4 family transposase [Pirellulales bacterium]